MHTNIFDYKTQAKAARILALENALTNSIIRHIRAQAYNNSIYNAIQWRL